MGDMERTSRRLVDLSHPIAEGMVTYPGLPGPELSDHLTRAEAEARYGAGVTFHIGRISMVANTGTYVDSPFHRYAEGADLAGLQLDRLVDLDGVVIDRSGSGWRDVVVDDLAAADVSGRAVLIRTGWDRHWGSDAYGTDAPFVSRAAAQWLVDQRVALVGIDSVNIDDTADLSRPAHSLLLGANTPVVEHLRGLEQLPRDGFRFHAAPAPIQRFGTFPVRAYAVIG
ncbi:MAG: cyclase family protein [Actinobacteria bacterium]|nr:cyclase family protein [Actinomycetota bacterium]